MKIQIEISKGDLEAKKMREEGPKRRAEVSDRLKGKKGKHAVNYRSTSEKANCGHCEYYDYPSNDESTCEKVAGTVEALDTCDLYEAPEEQLGQGQKPSQKEK